MKLRARWPASCRLLGGLPILALCAGCSGDSDEERCVAGTLAVAGSQLTYFCDGRLSIVASSGAPIVVGATAAAMLDATGETGRRLSTASQGEQSVEQVLETDALGEAQRLIATRAAAGEPSLRWTISGYAERGCYTFQVEVDNSTSEAVRVAKTMPLQLDGAEGGGLYLGSHPASHRILENGAHGALDFTVEVLAGDTPPNAAAQLIMPGDYLGHSVSNWNHAVADLQGPSTWVAGALTFAASLPVLNLSFHPDVSVLAPDGRQGFSYFSAESAYLPQPETVAAGETLVSELFYVHPSEPDAGVGLERYAEAVAEHLGIIPWTRRNGGQRVPNGWNSWSGSGSTGGYGTGIDEQLIIDNLDVMAEELRDWGMDWYQIDDGYEPAYGDWWFDSTKFPSGPAWLSQQIRARGLRPGLWMAPFTPDAASQLAQEHPGWLAAKTPLGQLVASDDLILDLTHPEVLAYLRNLFETFRNDWGFDWLKLDFGYYALFGTDFYDPAKTREQAWRDALTVIREALGDDAFFLLVGTIGINYGIVDGGRTTLDSMPIWDWDPAVSSKNHLEQQGFKPTVRTAGRRWYLQDRLWMNHPDLIFFRSNENDPTWPPVTLGESQAFCSFVGLSGGIVKLGDRLVDLQGDHINTIRQLLPIYGRAARPLDVFTREFPEVWHLSVAEPRDGYDEQWELLGLFNWGFNIDLTVSPYADMPDDGAPREHVVDLAALGLEGSWLAYEMWTQKLLSEVTDQLTVSVPSHAARVVALRRPTGRPQLLGWNRQITMGGTVLERVQYHEASRQLELQTPVAAPTVKAPFTYEIAFYVPDGFAFTGLLADGVAVDGLQASPEGPVLYVRFVPQSTGDLTLTITF